MHRYNGFLFPPVVGLLLTSMSLLLIGKALLDPFQGQNHSPLEVSISSATYSCEAGIHFSWRLKNVSQQIVYVYAPFLEGQAADILGYDANTGLVLIPTSMKTEASFPPYSYPEPTFRRLTPQDQIEGDFHEPISWQLSCKKLRPNKLVFEIAWGTDITKVLTEISRIEKEGLTHPANPIVHWAKLARSEPVPISYLKKPKYEGKRQKRTGSV